jgi:hypothetical protein
MILVRQVDGVWQRLEGEAVELERLVSTRDEHYHDGTIKRDVPCEPYPVRLMVSLQNIRKAVQEGAWGAEDLLALGIRIAIPFEPPKGKQIVGAPRYEEHDGEVAEVYEIEDLPPPPPEPSKQDRLRAMLAAYDLSIADLIELVAPPHETVTVAAEDIVDLGSEPSPEAGA